MGKFYLRYQTNMGRCCLASSSPMTPESTARAQQWQESSNLRAESPERGTGFSDDWESDRCVSFFPMRKGGKRKRFPSQGKRETVHQRCPAYFHSHAMRIMRTRTGISLPVYRRTRFLMSSLLPRPRNRRVERFVKGGIKASARNIPILLM